MKMIFNADEMVSINCRSCNPKRIQKRDIADYLTENSKAENCLENAVVLNQLLQAKSICLGEANNTIAIYPIYVKLSVSDELFNFLCRFLMPN